jgi:sensor histidine kinase YesM
MNLYRIKNGSLQIKILLVVLFVSLLNAGLTAFFFSTRVKNQITATTYQSLHISLQHAESRVLNEITRRSEMIYSLANQINLLATKDPDKIQSFLSRYLVDLHVNLNNSVNDSTNPLAAYIVYPDGKLIYAGLDTTLNDLKKRPWWNQILNGKTPDEELGFQMNSTSTELYSRLSFIGNIRYNIQPSAIMPLYWVATKNFGSLKYVVGIDFNADLSDTPIGPLFPINEPVGELFDPKGFLLAIPSQGSIVNEKYRLFKKYAGYNPLLTKALADDPSVSEGHLIYQNGKKKKLGMYRRGFMGYIYTQSIPLNEVYGPITREITAVIWISVVIAFIAALILSWFLLLDVVRPFHRLSLAMNRLGQGDFSTRIAEQRKDEFGQLYQSFNSTAAQLELLIQEAYVQRLARRQSELEFLQAQINPHFLYNTLDCIYRLIMGGDHEEGGRAIINLSRLFRLSLGRGPAIVTIKSAIEQLSHYIKLQQLRHGDRIQVEIRVDPDILKCQIPKLLLQPIVENAFIHGLEPKQGNGWLSISGLRENNMIHFIISDNGMGLNQEQLLRAEADLADTTSKNAHGMVNVHRRLKLAYGEEWGITLSANPDGGLRVEIRWPALEIE